MSRAWRFGVGGIVTAAGLFVGLTVPAAGQAHVLRDSSGRMLHMGHTRDRPVYIESGGSWGAQADAARSEVNSVMGGSLRLPAVGTHGSALVHVFTSNLGDSNILGATTNQYATTFAYHESSHYHVRWNSYYDYMDWTIRRSTACHELGHTIGLEHSRDASDCMVFGDLNAIANQRTLGTTHRDQARSAWNESGGH